MVLNIIKSPKLKQYIIVLTANLNLLSVGLGLGWPSPMLVKLQDSTNPHLDEPITDDQGAWVVSIGFLALAFMNFMPAILLNRVGFRLSIIIGMFPKVVGAFLLLFATEVWMLILGRCLCGISDTFAFTIVPTYASEIASKEIRGALSTILQVMCSLGVVTMLSVGPFVSYIAANVLHLTVIVTALLPIPFLPESPCFLYKKERTDQTLKLLTSLRGCETEAHEEIKEYAATDTGTKVNKMELFKDRIFLKSLGLVIMLVIGAQISGFNAVSFYLQTILESTQTSVRPEIASVIVGLIQFTASVFTTALTDRSGRKPILCSTILGMMLGMICLGVFFYVTDGADEIVGFMNFLPLMSITLVVFCFSAGPGSLNWALSAELFDNKSRAVGISISMVFSGLSLFFLTRYFPALMSSIGPAVTYWSFAGICLLFCAAIFFLIPETKGKTFAEIQRFLGAKIEVDEEKADKDRF